MNDTDQSPPAPVGGMLTAAEVAALFRVSAKTVGRWGRAGGLPLYRTIGGQHRYRVADVCALLGLDPGSVMSTD